MGATSPLFGTVELSASDRARMRLRLLFELGGKAVAADDLDAVLSSSTPTEK